MVFAVPVCECKEIETSDVVFHLRNDHLLMNFTQNSSSIGTEQKKKVINEFHSACKIKGLNKANSELLLIEPKMTNHELHETCHSVTFIVLVNSHQRWKQTWNRVCFHLGVDWLWRCGVTASYGVFFHERKCNGMTSFMEFMWIVGHAYSVSTERAPGLELG